MKLLTKKEKKQLKLGSAKDDSSIDPDDLVFGDDLIGNNWEGPKHNSEIHEDDEDQFSSHKIGEEHN